MLIMLTIFLYFYLSSLDAIHNQLTTALGSRQQELYSQCYRWKISEEGKKWLGQALQFSCKC